MGFNSAFKGLMMLPFSDTVASVLYERVWSIGGMIPTGDSELPYIMESNPHTFYSFRWLKNETRIRFAVVSWILEK